MFASLLGGGFILFNKLDSKQTRRRATSGSCPRIQPGVSGLDNDRTIFRHRCVVLKFQDQRMTSFSGPKKISGPDNDCPGGCCLVLKCLVLKF